jgi:prepilin-type N-terminal cleavage/methylation domain-containing protein
MTKTPNSASLPQAGFSLLEMTIVCAILTIILAGIFGGINTVIQRSQAEQVKVDLVQEGREFIDEFERDLHQAGYPNCRMVTVSGTTFNCPADVNNLVEEKSSSVAAGLVYLSNTKVVFEGDVDGDGSVDSVQYALVDSALNDPPTGNCPCSIRRSQIHKVDGTIPTAQNPVATTIWSQELQNVVNSGQPSSGNAYGNGLSISGSTSWGQTNNAFYASLSTFKDYPVFQAYDQYGGLIDLSTPLTIDNGTNSLKLNCSTTSTNCVKTVRITINLLGDAITGVDLQTHTRPVTTLIGDARLVNN